MRVYGVWLRRSGGVLCEREVRFCGLTEETRYVTTPSGAECCQASLMSAGDIKSTHYCPAQSHGMCPVKRVLLPSIGSTPIAASKDVSFRSGLEPELGIL